MTKQMIMDEDPPFLPQEIITNILKRLPVKSIIRFQCVCKYWKNLFKTSSFIAEHLHHSSQRKPSLLLKWDLHLDLLDCDMQVFDVHNTPLFDSLSLSQVSIIGSSNGLLCLKKMDEYPIYPSSLLLWNPALKEVRQVPRTINNFVGSCYLGFGFSPIVNDYKIVRIYGLEDEVYQVNRVEVYSLCTRSWKEVDFGNLEGVWISSETVTVNGAMFWFGYKVDEGKDYAYDLIVSFDIAKEVFTLIPMPDLEESTESEKLTGYDNKLAVLFEECPRPYEYCVKLWVMDEGTGPYRERWSWTKKYTSISCPCLVFLDPVTIWRKEIVCIPEFDVENDDNTKTVLYLFNLATNELKTFTIRRGYCPSIFNYVESLVSVGNILIEEP